MDLGRNSTYNATCFMFVPSLKHNIMHLCTRYIEIIVKLEIIYVIFDVQFNKLDNIQDIIFNSCRRKLYSKNVFVYMLKKPNSAVYIRKVLFT